MRTGMVMITAEHLALIIGGCKRRGNEWLRCCPFHSEKTPSFTVFTGKDGWGIYKCFGCGAAGNAVTWMRLKGDGESIPMVQRPDPGYVRQQQQERERQAARARILQDFRNRNPDA